MNRRTRHRHRATPVLESMSEAVTRWSGSSAAFALAAGSIVAWLVVGPLFHFSDTWQLVINTATTIVTFLMVFLIQRAQNKEALAIHLKLNEIVAALNGASNRLIDAERMSEKELESLESHYGALAELAHRDVSLTRSHSIEEARRRHGRKRGADRPSPSPGAAK
jgi:low affinity Fe/Cu permease